MSKGEKKTCGSNRFAILKLSIKAELDLIESEEGHTQKLAYILNQVHEYSTNTDKDKVILLYIYIMSALVHHKRHDGLSKKDLARLTNLMDDVLVYLSNIVEKTLYGTLQAEHHLIMSQLYQKEGKLLLSSWELYSSYRRGRVHPSYADGFTSLAYGIRLLRHGQALNALVEFEAAESRLPPGHQWEKARIGRIRCLRLAGDYSACDLIISETLADKTNNSVIFTKEAIWEQMLIAAGKSNDLTEIITAVQKSGDFHEAPYLGEAFLLARSVSQKKWLPRLPKIATIMTKKGYQKNQLGTFFNALQLLEKADVNFIPFEIRLASFKEVLEKLHLFHSIDRQMLYYLALTRWLIRHRSGKIATIILGEYQGICLKLSGGKSSDILMLAKDLIDHESIGDLANKESA